jgi:predicted ATP-grasp superfamily ATP-dependent carboligase
MKERKQTLTQADVVITHCRDRIGYNVLRSLGRKGLKVVVGVDQFSGMGIYSHYKYKSFSHPSFAQNERAFIQQLRQTLLKYTPQICIPTYEDIFVIAKYLDEFKDLPVQIPIANVNILNRLHDKYDSIQLAKSLGIPTPETLRPKNENEIFDFLKEYEEPIVLKIIRSSASRGVFYLNKNNLFLVLDKIMTEKNINYGDFLVQSYKKGAGYGVSMLFNQGQLRAKFTHKRLREKVFTGGPSTVRVGIRNTILEEYSEHLLSKVGFHGVAMVEFKHNEQTGDSWFIEVNPRFWGSLGLAIQSGVDFPYLLYMMAVEGDVTPCLDYKTGITVKWFLGDILAIINYMKSTNSIIDMKDIFMKIHGYDDFSLDDPLPILAEFFLYFNKIIRLKLSKSRSS